MRERKCKSKWTIKMEEISRQTRLSSVKQGQDAILKNKTTTKKTRKNKAGLGN